MTPDAELASLRRANAGLLADLGAAQDRQNASAEILRAIANTSGNAERSLQQIAEITARLFGCQSVRIRIAENNEWVSTIGVGASAERVDAEVSEAQGRIGGKNLPSTVVLENRLIHIPDMDRLDPEIADWPGLPPARAAGTRTMAGIPLRHEGSAFGVLVVYRDRLAPFTADELALLQSFADQAAIAIENARLFNETQTKTRDLAESLEQQTATSEVLKVISSSAGELEPVFKSMLSNALRICDAKFGNLLLFDGEGFSAAELHNAPAAYAELYKGGPMRPGPHTGLGRLIATRQVVHIADITAASAAQHDPLRVATAQILQARSFLAVPMLKEQELVGAIVIYRQEVRPFSDKQIELVTGFANQAVIAIENTRLLKELRQRTRDLTEALTYQTGSSNILKVIASSPTDVGPVLSAIVESACELCAADDALVVLRDGEDIVFMGQHGSIPVSWKRMAISRDFPSGRAILDRMSIHVPDLLSSEGEQFPVGRDLARRTGVRTILNVPMLREDEGIGAIVLRRTEVNPFSDKQIALLQTFADQAVIAIGNVRLFDEVQARTRDLSESLQQQTATADVLKVISRSAFDLQTVFETLIESAAQLCRADKAAILRLRDNKLHIVATHGFPPQFKEYMLAHPMDLDRGSVTGRAALDRRTVHVPDILADPEFAVIESQRRGGFRTVLGVPLLREGNPIGALFLTRGVVELFTQPQIDLVTTFADQAVIAIENARLFDEVQERTKELSQSLDELRTAQDRLVQTEKLASLGQLTAGIAHEIKNPLNFVNNFAALSAELTDELNDLLKPVALGEKIREEIGELTGMLKDNLQKVVQHGKRADSIVKNMLLHSREGSGEHRPAEINALLDESLNLAYHGARAEKPQFNVTLQRNFDDAAGMVEVFPQEITRVFLNLISNGFYAVTKRKTETSDPGFDPVLSASTRKLGDAVEIRIRDNGTGIPAEVKEKMFNPFFTTKPAGEGTGLGLSMSHDIIVKQHGGTIDVETEPGQFTEFRIVLPRTSHLQEKKRGET